MRDGCAVIHVRRHAAAPMLRSLPHRAVRQCRVSLSLTLPPAHPAFLHRCPSVDVCAAVTNAVPTDPVVSSKTGHLYERSVIEKHIAAEGTCPITGDEMTTADLLPVKSALPCACVVCLAVDQRMEQCRRPDAPVTAAACPASASKGVKPRPVGASSVPGMLSMLQDEWDAMMLEHYTLREHLNTVRQELSQALYQHDAACRVIARITKVGAAAVPCRWSCST